MISFTLINNMYSKFLFSTFEEKSVHLVSEDITAMYSAFELAWHAFKQSKEKTSNLFK